MTPQKQLISWQAAIGAPSHGKHVGQAAQEYCGFPSTSWSFSVIRPSSGRERASIFLIVLLRWTLFLRLRQRQPIDGSPSRLVRSWAIVWTFLSRCRRLWGGDDQ